MKVLQELVRFNRLDDEADDMAPEEDLLSDLPDELDSDIDTGMGEEPVDGELPPEEEPTEPTEPTEPEDPNRQGMVRTVKGAHLVYKREVEDGTYEELWQYNISTLRDEITIRKAILAGTDIPVNKAQSTDGSQTFQTWAVGNAELLLVRGLPA